MDAYRRNRDLVALQSCWTLYFHAVEQQYIAEIDPAVIRLRLRKVDRTGKVLSSRKRQRSATFTD